MSATSKNVTLGEPVRFRPDAWMRKAIDEHARKLSAEAGVEFGASAAIRDLLHQALRGAAQSERAMSGFREGFVEGLRRTAVTAAELARAARRAKP